ncbi:MAG TPA: saccharopine dehydrogenase NADP-binding domain-containing protein, partial [Verrucomicrobiae bacterium]|nr:saccharopine dehydrogenase NADP-binding domain-containing protein [Verrucomicrobiae bacterium]
MPRQKISAMLEFKNKILFVGYGAVAQCALPILFKHLKTPAQNVTVMDFEDRRGVLAPWLKRGVKFARKRVTRENMGELLGKYLSAGDVLIDLAWNIDCCEILQWCHERGVLYVNTSVELWDPYENSQGAPPQKMTLYWRHMNLRRMISQWSQPGPTAVVEHGANPGLISHFTKQGLIDIGKRAIKDRKITGSTAEEVQQLIAGGKFNRLAMKLGVKVVHCSERDTQITDEPKAVDEFANTWSVEGFREEGTTTAEMGWGTHEKELPELAHEHADGPRNQICLARMGINTWVRSWVP